MAISEKKFLKIWGLWRFPTKILCMSHIGFLKKSPRGENLPPKKNHWSGVLKKFLLMSDRLSTEKEFKKG
jgi:hypothetical protein